MLFPRLRVSCERSLFKIIVSNYSVATSWEFPTKIWGNIIRNVTSQDRRRIDLTAQIGHDVDIDRAEAILHEIIAADERILTEPPALVKANKINDYAVELIIRPWALTENYWPIYWDLTKAIKKRLDSEGISFPHPQQDIFIRENPDNPMLSSK